jgi:hypothetical protein
MERGIITPAMEITSQGNSFTIRGGIPPEKLRYYILYWDKVVFTDSNIFGTGLSGELETLEKAKIVSKSTARMNLNGRFSGSDLTKIHFQGLAQIATTLINENPGQWAIHQSCDHLIIPSGMTSEFITADLELAQCLPVPKSDIPLDKVLDFKMRHADELLALRMTLDELYLEITKSSDIPRSKIVQIQRLEQAIKDLDQVAKQSWGERLLASRKVSLDINYGSLTQGAVTAGLVGTTFSNPLIGLIAGAAQTIASSMKFEVSVTPQLGSARGQQVDLSYLSAIKHEDIAN